MGTCVCGKSTEGSYTKCIDCWKRDRDVRKAVEAPYQPVVQTSGVPVPVTPSPGAVGRFAVQPQNGKPAGMIEFEKLLVACGVDASRLTRAERFAMALAVFDKERK